MQPVSCKIRYGKIQRHPISEFFNSLSQDETSLSDGAGLPKRERRPRRTAFRILYRRGSDCGSGWEARLCSFAAPYPTEASEAEAENGEGGGLGNKSGSEEGGEILHFTSHNRLILNQLRDESITKNRQ